MSQKQESVLTQKLKKLQQKITLYTERDRLERLLEQTDNPDITRPQPFELLHHRGQLAQLQQQEAHLQKRLAHLKRKQEPTKSVWDHFYDAQDKVEQTADKIEAARDEAASWYRKHWPSKYADRKQLSDGDLVQRQIERDIAKYFPEDHRQRQQNRKIQRRIAKEQDRYLDENERRNARTERREASEWLQAQRHEDRLILQKSVERGDLPEIKLEPQHNWKMLEAELTAINQQITAQREPERDR